MAFCTGCGHRLGVGRFCTNCGRPIAAPSTEADSVERAPAHVPSSPPPAYTPPPAARYPLFSDELSAAAATVRPTPPPPDPHEYRPVAPAPRGSGPSFVPVALVVLLLVLVAVIGGLLLFSGGDQDSASDPSPPAGTAPSESAPPSATPSEPSSGPSDDPPPPPSDEIQDVAQYATAAAPSTAKPNRDTSGNMVRYDAANMVDGVPTTCWRTPGDASGLELTFTFPEPVVLSEVGMINGYAKRSGALDWYVGNRKVLAATWVFDDGTELPQSLSENRRLQSISVGSITTTTVVLRLDSVSEPGSGPSSRNNTAISDVSLVGAPA